MQVHRLLTTLSHIQKQLQRPHRSHRTLKRHPQLRRCPTRCLPLCLCHGRRFLFALTVCPRYHCTPYLSIGRLARARLTGQHTGRTTPHSARGARSAPFLARECSEPLGGHRKTTITKKSNTEKKMTGA